VRNAVFLVKNGIGFGHIRRALLLAEAVASSGRLRPVVVSQASSLALYHDSRVRVVNFPLLHRVPSAIAEDFYTDVLNHLLDRLDPAVVVEDTYPDARYRRLPALADRPKVLVMRRLDGLSLDQIRQRGELSHYDRILIAQEEIDFRREGHSGETLAAVESSRRFAIVGNIACTPRPAEMAAVRREYAPDGAPLVVVNGGAGGDQMPDGYGHRLFHACRRIATTLAKEGNPAVFVLVTGPYYAGAPLRPSRTVTVRRFEPRLPALLAAADVTVIKPGNNALSEALAGAARLILVPDQSFMEGLDEHAARIAARYGGAVGRPDQASLEPLVRQALARPPRPHRIPPSTAAIDAVVRELHEQADGRGRACVRHKHLLLGVVPTAGSAAEGSVGVELPPQLRDAAVVEADRPDGAVLHVHCPPAVRGRGAYSVIVGEDPPDDPPQALADRGTRMIIRTCPSAAVDRWLRRQPARPAFLVVPADRVVARPGFPDGAVRRIARLFRSRASAVVILDLARLSGTDAKEYLDHVGQWMASQPLQLVDVREIAAELANRWVET
jgi:hypothetical protein